MPIRLHCLLVVAIALSSTGARVDALAIAPKSHGAQDICAAPPILALSPGFEDARGTFGPNSRAFRSVQKRFAAAYRIACRNGGLKTPLMSPGASGGGRLFLKNAPHGNTVSIYQEDFQHERPTGPMMMEFPFIDDKGRPNLPKVEEVRSAIVCSVYYSDPPKGPVGDILECLVD
jgi:hypothetical protein